MAKKKEEVEVRHMGTHDDMVLRTDIVATLSIPTKADKKNKEDFTVIAEDKNGKYFTQKHFVGNGLLDPNRDPERRRPITSLTEDANNKFFPNEVTEEATA